MTPSLNDSGIVGNPKQLLLELASLHQFAELFPLAVQRLAEASSVALVRIWITKPPLPGDCSSCRFANECLNRERCLHLVASSGRSLNDAQQNWQQVNGAFRRFPHRRAQGWEDRGYGTVTGSCERGTGPRLGC